MRKALKQKRRSIFFALSGEMIQGYYYSRPIPRDEYEKLLEQEGSAALSKEKSALVTLGNINAIFGEDSLVNSILDGFWRFWNL